MPSAAAGPGAVKQLMAELAAAELSSTITSVGGSKMWESAVKMAAGTGQAGGKVAAFAYPLS